MKLKRIIWFYSILIFALIVAVPAYAAKQFKMGKPQSVKKKPTDIAQVPAEKKILTNPNQVRIPDKFALIKETWTPQADMSQRMVIHIQDAHCNYEAQTNIANVIDNLMDEYPEQVRLVAVEGSVGLIDTSPFAEFSDAEIKDEVADYFMKKGKITGPEYLSITGPHQFTIYGIEKKEIYDRNYKAFLDSLPFRDKSEECCSYLGNVFNQLKEHIYSPLLLELDKELKEYHDGEMSFSDYVSLLSQWVAKQKVSLKDYPNFTIMEQIQQIESNLNFKNVERERTMLIDKLGKLLSAEGTKELVRKSLLFKTGKLTAAEYYNYLKKTVGTVSGLPLDEYTDLMAYIDYVNLNERMDKTELFNECSKLEEAVVESLCVNDEQKELFRLSRNTKMLEVMFKLELVKEDYLYYKEHKDDFRVDNILNFLKKQAPRYGVSFTVNPEVYEIDEHLPIVEEFYEVAIIRDDILIDNMLAKMERDDADVCVLITGGFHSKGITSILKDKRIPYVVISPMITKVPEYNPYIDIMTNKKTPFEEFLEQLGE